MRLRLGGEIAADAYAQCHATGAFILVDEATNDTVAAGMVLEPLDDVVQREEALPGEREAVLGLQLAVVDMKTWICSWKASSLSTVRRRPSTALR